MTLTFKLDLESVKTNLRVKNLGQRSFGSKIVVRYWWKA